MDEAIEKKKWFNEEVRFFVTMGSLLVAIVIAWAGFGTRIALIEQSITTIESNHLTHIQAAVEKLQNDMVTLLDSVIRIEEQHKAIMNTNN